MKFPKSSTKLILKPAMNPSKIGIFGGSFNPVHIGHLIIAQHFVEELTLDICFFEPNYISPFKIEDNDIIQPHLRLEMLKLAIEENPKFKVDTYEVDKAEISYTYQTILHFKNNFPNSHLYLLVGSDQAEKFIFWKNWETILDNAFLVVAKRKLELFEPAKFNFSIEHTKKVILLSNPIIEISSSTIRNYLKSGRSIRYLVPEKIFNFIVSNKLFE